MSRYDLGATLAEFFRDEFASDPAGVADWLAQSDQDVDAFIAELDSKFPKQTAETAEQ